MDEEPRPQRRSNAHISDTLGTRLLEALSDTNLDQWDVKDRREMQANLGWVSDRRKAEAKRMVSGPTRRWALGLLAAAAFTALQIFGSWLGGTAANATRCPNGDTCVPTAIQSPHP